MKFWFFGEFWSCPLGDVTHSLMDYVIVRKPVIYIIRALQNQPLHLHAVEPRNLRVTFNILSRLCCWPLRANVEMLCGMWIASVTVLLRLRRVFTTR